MKAKRTKKTSAVSVQSSHFEDGTTEQKRMPTNSFVSVPIRKPVPTVAFIPESTDQGLGQWQWSDGNSSFEFPKQCSDDTVAKESRLDDDSLIEINEVASKAESKQALEAKQDIEACRTASKESNEEKSKAKAIRKLVADQFGSKLQDREIREMLRENGINPDSQAIQFMPHDPNEKRKSEKRNVVRRVRRADGSFRRVLYSERELIQHRREKRQRNKAWERFLFNVSLLQCKAVPVIECQTVTGFLIARRMRKQAFLRAAKANFRAPREYASQWPEKWTQQNPEPCIVPASNDQELRDKLIPVIGERFVEALERGLSIREACESVGGLGKSTLAERLMKARDVVRRHLCLPILSGQQRKTLALS